MAYDLHKSGVITGSLNSYCLACEHFLQSQQDAKDHVATPLHLWNVNSVQYSEKFPDEHIKKFEGGYYCEFCNLLLPIASKVNVHLSEEEHILNKGTLLLKPLKSDILAFNKFLIEERAWHGLIDGVCSLCNAEFDDENEHKSNPKHSLNLVLKPVKFGVDGAIYRHLDDSAVQCLTCNKLLAPCKLTNHLVDDEHKQLITKSRVDANGSSNGETESNNNSAKENNNNKELKNDNDFQKKPTTSEVKSKILESVVKYQTKGININLETDTAFCKKCSEVITFDSKEIDNHIETHSLAKTVDSDLLYPSNLHQNLNRVDINDKTTKSADGEKNTKDEKENIKQFNSIDDTDGDDIDPKQNDEEAEAKHFAKENQINYNEINNQSYCRICEVQLPASFKSMKEHVAGANHRKLAGSTKAQLLASKASSSFSKPVKVETKQFLDSAYDVEGFFYHDSIVNEDFCVPRNSFYLITKNNAKFRCLICEVNLPPFCDIEDHIKTRQHQVKFLKVPVLTSEESELIREVKPGLYHCAYCNLVISSWNEMKQHLECYDHNEKKSQGENRLRRHLPGLQRYKLQKELEAMSIMRLFHMFN